MAHQQLLRQWLALFGQASRSAAGQQFSFSTKYTGVLIIIGDKNIVWTVEWILGANIWSCVSQEYLEPFLELVASFSVDGIMCPWRAMKPHFLTNAMRVCAAAWPKRSHDGMRSIYVATPEGIDCRTLMVIIARQGVYDK